MTRHDSPADLTTRARIRDGALALFGRDGYSATSVRDIATYVGVSAGLVIHHFGSKEQLRRECDDQVVRLITEKAEKETKPSASVLQELMRDVEAFGPIIDYLARMFSDNSPNSERLFDLLFAETKAIYREGVQAGTMRESSDEEMFSALLLACGLAPLLLRGHLTRTFQTDYLSAEFLNRIMIPSLELYTNGLYSDDTMLAAAKQLTADHVRDAGS